jgi:hypothetical protein
MYLSLVPFIPPFESSPLINLNSVLVFKCRLYLGRCPCCTLRSPMWPHLMMVAPPGPASIDRVSFFPHPPVPKCRCHMLPKIPDSTTISSMPSAPLSWLFLFSSSDSQSLDQDPNLSSLDENEFVSFLPRRLRGGNLIVGSPNLPACPIFCFNNNIITFNCSFSLAIS